MSVKHIRQVSKQACRDLCGIDAEEVKVPRKGVDDTNHNVNRPVFRRFAVEVKRAGKRVSLPSVSPATTF